MNSNQKKDAQKLTLTIPSDLVTEMRVKAVRTKKSVSSLAVEAFEDYLTKNLEAIGKAA